MKTIACLDGDLISYRCAASNEKRSIKAKHKVTGQVTEYAHITAFRAHIKDLFSPEEFVIEDVQVAEDIKNAYHGMKTTIASLCKSCDADEYEIYISGETNFRDDLPLPTKYKGSREDTIRPLQLKQCRQYLVDHHGAIAAVGQEADDCLAQRGYEGTKKVKTIVVTLDKDANGSEGWLYNWNTMFAPTLISGLGEILLDDKKKLRGTGRKWFYAQWVMGDPVDCFKPCEISGKKFGDVGCYKLLSACKTDRECVEAVYKQYKSWYPSEVVYNDWTGKKHTTDAIRLMDLYAACSHMRRFDGDVFDTKKLLDKLEIKYD